jgi:diguanylate cyclase (GGDEF)-like protein/PAS domain S-box-containing protein
MTMHWYCVTDTEVDTVSSSPLLRISEQYFEILQGAVLASDASALEVHLTAAFELGRVMVEQNVPPDEVVNIHHEMVVRLSRVHPELMLAQISSCLNRPLMEMSMAYGMTFREQMEQRYESLAFTHFQKLQEQETSGVQLGDIFNDFNNLLGSIIGFSEMAGEELSAKSVGQKKLNKLMGSLNALLTAEQFIQQRVRINERQLRTLLDNSPDIIVRYDLAGRCVFANRAYTRETGLTEKQILHANVSRSVILQKKDDARTFGQRLQQVTLSGIPDIILLEWRHPQGHLVSHEMHVVPEYDDNDCIFGTLAIGRDVTKRKAAELALHYQANFDLLSGLPNRRRFEDMLQLELARAEQDAYPLALLFIDLDHFKDVNDLLGHAVGDQLLVVVAQRIRASLRESDTVARVAGDEFIAILPQLGPSELLTRMGQSLVAAIAQPFHLSEHNKVFVSASVGVALFPDDADTAPALIGCADQAMLAAKTAGRNKLAFFTSSMRTQNVQRHQLLRDLREAIREEQFVVYYQPIIDLETGEIHKAEALVRWLHPTLGMVPPDQFIPLAEETSLIHELGAWVLREAVTTARLWNTQAASVIPKQIGVNLSPVQFSKGQCDRLVLDMLQQIGAKPEHIAVEITEGLLLDDSPGVIAQLRQLRAAGVHISLDDFGTGYSAMSYLKKFSMDYLKIDRSFVCDMGSSPGNVAIVEAMVVMAHRLGMKVVAEGIETREQAALLTAAGCDYAQGFLYSRPIAADAFLSLVSLGGLVHADVAEMSIAVSGVHQS